MDGRDLGVDEFVSFVVVVDSLERRCELWGQIGGQRLSGDTF